jgi:CRP-like cAMP-binding protein
MFLDERVRMIDEEATRVLKSGWLGHLDPALACKILNAGKMAHYGDGDTIYAFAQEQSRLFGVARGMVRMWVTMNEQAPQFGHVAGPGFWFGETELVTGNASIMEMTASGATSLFRIDRKAIDTLAAEAPGIWQGIALLAVMNEGTALGAADDLMVRKSRERLAAVLLRLSSHRNAPQGVPPLREIPVTQAELSEAVCLSRSSTAALLAEFVRSGLIRTDYGAIAILDPAGLVGLLTE